MDAAPARADDEQPQHQRAFAPAALRPQVDGVGVLPPHDAQFGQQFDVAADAEQERHAPPAQFGTQVVADEPRVADQQGPFRQAVEHLPQQRAFRDGELVLDRLEAPAVGAPDQAVDDAGESRGGAVGRRTGARLHGALQCLTRPVSR